MSRRSLTLLIAGLATLVAIAVAVLVPVPYVILGPGPTLNTLGADSSGQPLITISGHPTYPAKGNLNMVTVSYEGGPGANLNIFQALRAWLNSSEAVVPETELFPPGQSAQQTQAQDTAQMAGSQQTAQAAAFNALHIPFQTEVAVLSTVPGTPAAGVLKAGDVMQSVDGVKVTDGSSLARLITSHPAGSVLKLSVLRSGKVAQVDVRTKESGGRPIIGVDTQEQYKFPFQVKFSVGDIGGPSAGMMFALGIIDKLTKLNLAGGKFIAGTGEITAAGQVEKIGGIQQKMVGARDAGATVFLAPAGNCPDVAGATPAGLRVVKVSTLSQAMSDLEAIKAGKSVPSC
ncbi:MAG TPA: PDZ domain-containing protein [Trebonia sp.]|jgi:PDZ domain-containing protein|nr:PDZ domain-containing protein [Trebonia sp.]